MDSEGLIGEIERLERVKDVYVDSSYSRSLFVDDFDEKKRPGKIFSSMSFEEGEEGRYSALANASISWRRNILMQVQSSSCFCLQFC